MTETARTPDDVTPVITDLPRSCPTCNAAPGERCMSWRGKPMLDRVHVYRGSGTATEQLTVLRPAHHAATSGRGYDPGNEESVRAHERRRTAQRVEAHIAARMDDLDDDVLKLVYQLVTVIEDPGR
ncbi:hypothetical protein [Enterococcus hirae]|uniref:hypothetical protein n=1 Tax=Enterococcus hirae TaxID=1354 RepID=UPI0013695507|nr:hypothetical protein [Enterococcus hirae]NAE18267.1 hypothetical protein [Enterococcus hirae]